MKIEKLFLAGEAKIPEKLANTEITTLRMKSYQCLDGSLYFAIKGGRFNGADFAAEAISHGAVAVVAEKDIPDVTTIVVENVRQAMSLAAARFYGEPAKKLKLIGIVGTNGKTTTATLLSGALDSLGKRTVNIGTLGATIDGVSEDFGMTTPDPIELHRILASAVEKQAQYAVMEVSAHAIYFGKMYGLSFELGIFTNLTQDHLDFFQTMEHYSFVKKSFFLDGYPKVSIINADDKIGREIIAEGAPNTITYGVENPADVFAIDVNTTNGLSYMVNALDLIGRIECKLNGYFNVYNTLAVLTALIALGIDIDTVTRLINSAKEVKGRFNVINGRKKVIIDYAHTPDGLSNVLRSAREYGSGRVIAVFGCGGNRDRIKRRVMGRISGTMADLTIVTTDNSRYEDPYEIMDEIAAGVESSGGYIQKIRDRADAIQYAVDLASPFDVIVVAGKGAEEYMDECGILKPYSDYDAVTRALGRL